MLAVTMGDSSGVGPEILLKAYKQNEIGCKFIAVGDYDVLNFCNELLNYDVALKKIEDVSQYEKGFLNIYDLGIMQYEDVKKGEISEKSGYAAAQYVIEATKLAQDKKVDAIVTLPMNKEATRLTMDDFSGHTELIAKLCGQDSYTMMLSSDKLTVTHVNTHVSMVNAIANIKAQRVYDVIKLTYDSLSKYIKEPQIAVAGLNAHAGENGLFGREEIDEIRPAVEMTKSEGINAIGPEPPDTVFLKASQGKYDAVVCMYHDQGHIPMKLLDFEGGVNVTLGLDVIRTSVDHGTAFDIAYKDIASTKSFVQAVNMALKMTGNNDCN